MILGTVLISYLMSIYSPQSKEAYNNNHVNISQFRGLTAAHLCCFSPNLSGGLSRVSDIAGVEYLTTLHSSIWLLFPHGELYSIDIWCGHSLWQPHSGSFCGSSGFQKEWSSGPDSEVLEYYIFHILLVKSVKGRGCKCLLLKSLSTMNVICFNYKCYTHWLLSIISELQDLCHPGYSFVMVWYQKESFSYTSGSQPT